MEKVLSSIGTFIFHIGGGIGAGGFGLGVAAYGIGAYQGTARTQKCDYTLTFPMLEKALLDMETKMAEGEPKTKR